MRTIIAVLALACLAACRPSGERNADASAGNETAIPPPAPKAPPPGPAPQLSSAAFDFNEGIPANFTCDGAGEAPPLEWTEPLPGTRSFALILDDPDALGGTFHHWGIYDIPVSARSIPDGEVPGRTLVNDFGKRGYGAPCPPKGAGLHDYRFKLYGLNVDHLPLSPDASIADLQAAVLNNSRTESMLIGLYERK